MTSVELVGDWQLSVDGSVGHGHCSLVVAVRSTSGRPAVLKVGYPDAESEHEPLALQHWHGDGAVQLLRADPHRRALLLERLHDESLVGLWDEEACQVGDPYRLHLPAPPQLRRLSGGLDEDRARDWAVLGTVLNAVGARGGRARSGLDHREHHDRQGGPGVNRGDALRECPTSGGCSELGWS